MNRLQEVLRADQPSVAAVVTSPLENHMLESVIANADVIEMRADLFPSQEIDYLRKQAQILGRIPLLLTVRSSLEGGAWDGGDGDRWRLYEDLIEVVDGVDFEMDSMHIRHWIREKTINAGKVCILSKHDFSDTNSVEELVAKYNRNIYGADYLKFACTVNDVTAYKRLAEFTVSCGEQGKLISVGMGMYGPLSRITLPSLGSRLTYAFVGDVAVAPGQMNLQTTREIVDQLYPH
jgi:3-dehydroquinate dehydratase I